MSTQPPTEPPADRSVRRLAEQLDAAAEAAGAADAPARGVPDAFAAAVVAQLADESTWTPPPPQLRDDVLARVLGSAAPARPAATAEPIPLPVRRAQPEPSQPEPSQSESSQPEPSQQSEPQRPTRRDAVVRPLVPRWRRLTWAVPAVAAAAVLITGGVLAVDHAVRDSQPGTSYVALGTPAAPDATAKVTVAEAAGGFSVVLDLHGLPAAPAGTYYSAWLNDGHVSVPLGSFHARGNGGPIKLWSGVDPRRFTPFTVTLQRDDQPPFPPGERYLTGRVSR